MANNKAKIRGIFCPFAIGFDAIQVMPHPSQQTIFLEALDREEPDQRAAYLRDACGDDAQLRCEVEALLAAHDRPGNALDRPPLSPVQMDETLDAPAVQSSSHIGTTIGPYRLMEQIGEGGFGLVFVAQQEKPVRRKVALKIIKPGMASQQILARFDAERQAVAIMDHPNIARVFDAGVTDDARPYFVMELVKGLPITKFCDQHAMPLRQRLELFRDVCAATQHAHQKGVIHRDLKPSNVMVTMHDDKPVVKVIDFGVAKAIGQNLTDQTIYTQFYAVIGTPLYMSPEQAAMSGLDVDTRSDIYSLGVLLYELLTGTTPFDRHRLETAGYDEMRRIIREEQPPRPSIRLTTIQAADTNTTVQPRTHVELTVAKQREAIPTDLDWIVMKAVEKDRTRRYESSSAMSDDLRRFLESVPIEARPPSKAYRLRKFAARNRAALLTATLVATTLLLGTAASLYQASRAVAERDEKESALRDAIEARNEVEQFADNLKNANQLVSEAIANENAEEFAAANAKFNDAVDLMPNYYLVWFQRAMMRARLSLWDEAAEDFSKAMRLEAPLASRQWEGAAALFYVTGRSDDYREIYSRLLKQGADDTRPLTFNTLRSCLIDPLNATDAKRLADDSETLLDESEANGFGGPGFGPPEPGSRRPDGPQRDGPRPGGPRGPDDGPGRPMFAPRSVLQYIAGWARLRAGQPRQALRWLELASHSRGPSGTMVHSLRAMAYHQLGDDGQAETELALADDALRTMTDNVVNRSGNTGPWIDFVEMMILHREATEMLTGATPEIDPQFEAFQQRGRRSLGLAD